MNPRPRVVIVTGMSGAGRSQAAKVLEDVGYFVVDNLPPSLIQAVVAHSDVAEQPRSRLAVVVDTRGGLEFSELDEAVLAMVRAGLETTVVFMDASDETLVRRYEETRRRHPVAADSLAQAIAIERRALEDLRGNADLIVDTTRKNVHELRDTLREAFAGERPQRQMQIDITSFGFKRGVPRVLDLLFDVRFLPNPHWQEELRPLTGRDEPVRDYVLSHDDAKEFVRKTEEMLAFLIPRYEAEGKLYLTIGVGCTGGRHRSVAIAEALKAALEERDVAINLHHRDVNAADQEQAV